MLSIRLVGSRGMPFADRCLEYHHREMTKETPEELTASEANEEPQTEEEAANLTCMAMKAPRESRHNSLARIE